MLLPKSPQTHPDQEKTSPPPTKTQNSPYHTPTFKELGDIKEVTLNFTGAGGDGGSVSYSAS